MWQVPTARGWLMGTAKNVELAEIPARTSNDCAELASWYSGYAYFELYRKVLLASCRESIRAQYTANGERVTESRLDDLSHLHRAYLAYLGDHLKGRILWEREHLKQGFGP